MIADNDGFDYATTDDADRIRALIEAVPGKDNVLDLGCGSGRNVELLKEYFKKITLVERNSKAIKRASKIAGKALA